MSDQNADSLCLHSENGDGWWVGDGDDGELTTKLLQDIIAASPQQIRHCLDSKLACHLLCMLTTTSPSAGSQHDSGER
jgi:hypothetical protein